MRGDRELRFCAAAKQLNVLNAAREFFKGEYFTTVQKNESTHIALGIDIGYDPGQERFDTVSV